MNLNELISIIVPVYNVEKYIEKCLKSILLQTYENIEIILIDDGSIDSSGKICDYYSSKYKKIKTFHKENGGLADARNYGLDKAKGNYVCFIDSDDFINQNMIKELYSSLKRNKTQIVACKFKNVNEEFELKNSKLKINIQNEIVFNKKEALKAMVNLNLGFAPNVCNKLFEKNLFTKDCYFPDGRLYEDMIVMTKILNKVNLVSYIDCELYYYVQRKNSITEKFNLKEIDHIDMSNEVLDFVFENCRSVYKHFVTYHAINYMAVINKMIKNNFIDNIVYTKARKFIKNNEKIIFNDDNISFKKKVQLYIFMCSKKIYLIIYKIGG